MVIGHSPYSTLKGVAMEDRKIKHLEMIQNIINRMASNSFLLKGWNVILVSALFALAAKDQYLAFVYLAYFPAIAFWILDGYFLWQERLFRALYDHVRVETDDKKIDFSMNTKPFLKNVNSWVETIFSNTLLIFHGTVIASIILVMSILLFLKYQGA
jgi:hypothetical protein